MSNDLGVTRYLGRKTSVNISEFDYSLPGELIAQAPAPERSGARLLVVRRTPPSIAHHLFRDLPALLQPGDLLVINNTKVFPARLTGRLEGTRRTVEVFLIREHGPARWEALVRPGRKLREGTRVFFDEGLIGRVLEVGPFGRRTIGFAWDGDFFALLDRIGQTPLPPYIRRAGRPGEADRLRYQTVYARMPGSVAAPTAGLHFTPEVLQALDRAGVRRCEITLHVGYGTFQPVRVEPVEAHRMEPEYYTITSEAAEMINAQKAAGLRIIAVGTTTTRALESVAAAHGGVLVPGAGSTDLFIYPGFSFCMLSGLITNFHLPRSTLLMLVCAFAGRDWTLAWYHEAIRERYRFYSYGDCALIL